MTRILCAYGVTDNNVYVISNGIFATEGEAHGTRAEPCAPRCRWAA